MQVRAAVSKELEQVRSKGEIGASLNAEVELYADDSYFNDLQPLANELHFIFITSKATLASFADAPANAIDTELKGLKVKITASTHTKCVRCWHQRADVGTHAEHPELCGRCVENVDEQGEVRHYA
jgi:isoleucyl-tRNA synthetase